MEAILNEVNDAQETPAHRINAGSVISGLSVNQNWDADYAVGTERVSSTDSLRSSIYAHAEENCRLYHKYMECKYYFPNDKVEQERLDLQHHLPFNIGRQTGSCTHRINSKCRPLNCRFEVGDAEDDWIYSHKFDSIHGLMLGSCFNSHVKVFESAFLFLCPGGWFEMQDFAFPLRCIDDTTKGAAFERWLESIAAGCEKLGKDLGRAPVYDKYIHARYWIR